MTNLIHLPLHSFRSLPSGSRPSLVPRLGCQVAMVRVTGSNTKQSCQGDDYKPFQPSSNPLGHSQVLTDPPQPQDWAATWPWSGLHMGSLTSQSCPRDMYGPFEPSSSPLCLSQVAPDSRWYQDWAARRPLVGVGG